MTVLISHLIHPGTPSRPGDVGTSDPAIWSHTFFLESQRQVYHAILYSDITKAAPPDYDTILAHWATHPEMWVLCANIPFNLCKQTITQ